MGTIKAQVHLVATKGKSNIGLNINRLYYYNPVVWGEAQHLYFTTDEEIKEGDWVLIGWENGDIEVKKALTNSYGDSSVNIINLDNGWCYEKLARKIVATTNPELWEEEVMHWGPITKCHKIDTPFIEAYIKAYNEGNPIKEVNLGIYWEPFSGIAMLPPKLKLKSNGSVIIHPVKEEMYNYQEVKKMFEHLSYELAQQIIGNRPKDPIVPHEWFEKNYPQ